MAEQTEHSAVADTAQANAGMSDDLDMDISDLLSLPVENAGGEQNGSAGDPGEESSGNLDDEFPGDISGEGEDAPEEPGDEPMEGVDPENRALIKKYGGDPNKLATAYRHLQRMHTKGGQAQETPANLPAEDFGADVDPFANEKIEGPLLEDFLKDNAQNGIVDLSNPETLQNFSAAFRNTARQESLNLNKKAQGVHNYNSVKRQIAAKYPEHVRSGFYDKWLAAASKNPSSILSVPELFEIDLWKRGLLTDLPLRRTGGKKPANRIQENKNRPGSIINSPSARSSAGAEKVNPYGKGKEADSFSKAFGMY